MGKLVDKTIGGIVGVCWSRALLVRCLGSLKSLVVGSRRLLGVRGGILAVVEVASRCEACGVWLLLRTLSLCLLTTALCLSREDRVREGGRGRWVGCSVRKCLTVVVQVQVERPTIVVVHLSGRHRSESTDFEEGSKVIQRYVVVVRACSSSKEGSQLSGCFHFHFRAPNWLAEWGKTDRGTR
jgi:hypothetical protein